MPDLSLLQWFFVELGVLALAVLFALWTPWQNAAAALLRPLRRLAERPTLCFWTIVAASILLRLALLPLERVPLPLYHDEFSYLLGADTFFHARLTNPTPPVPLALETIHTNMWPTYESMYMPGPALLLVVGQVLGSPWIAVMLITALFCAMLYWAVSAWLPRSYALLASGLALAFSGTMNWWFDNYFCLGLSCLGTTLVLGSLPRILAARRWQSTAPLAVGLVMLMLTRPYEGFCVTFPMVLVLLWRLRPAGAGRIVKLAALPVALLCATTAWLFYYNWRGTGHALLFPYSLNFREYHITGAFLFSAKHPLPVYDLGMLRRFYIFAEVPQYEFMRAHPFLFFFRKVTVYYAGYLYGFGLLLIAGLAYVVRRFREGLLLAPAAAFAGFGVNVVLMAWSPFPQYAAPAAPVLYLLVLFGLFALCRVRAPRWSGQRLVYGLLLAELMLSVSLFGYRISESRDFPEPQYVSKDRAHVAAEVLSHPGKQLCLVRYIRYHDGWQEWVFNGADPEAERLVWARSLSPEMDQKVIAAYPGRTVWLVKPDTANQLVQPYSPALPFLPIDKDPLDKAALDSRLDIPANRAAPVTP